MFSYHPDRSCLCSHGGSWCPGMYNWMEQWIRYLIMLYSIVTTWEKLKWNMWNFSLNLSLTLSTWPRQSCTEASDWSSSSLKSHCLSPIPDANSWWKYNNVNTIKNRCNMHVCMSTKFLLQNTHDVYLLISLVVWHDWLQQEAPQVAYPMDGCPT